MNKEIPVQELVQSLVKTEDVQKFYITFQFDDNIFSQYNESTGYYDIGYALIEAPDYKTARQLAWVIFGESMTFIYREEDWDAKRPEAFSLGCLFQLNWIQRTAA